MNMMKNIVFTSGENRSMKRFSLCIMAAILCLILSACGGAPPSQSPEEKTAAPTPPTATTTPKPPAISEYQMTDFEIESNLENSYAYEYSEFNLGDGLYTTPGNHKMPYKIRGIIAVPDGAGPFPLVLIAHGAHEEEDESRRFDTGFDYLVEGLAQNGYIAVSVDMLMPYIQRYGGNDDYVEKILAIMQEHIQGLRSANDSEALYPMDLTGKLDFGKTALLGHSRSGSAVFQIAKEELERGLGVGFFNTSFGEDDFFYQLAQPQANKMYGRDINRQLRLSDPINLIETDTADELSSETASIRHAVDAMFFKDDEVLVNTVTTNILKTILDGTRDKEAETLEYVPFNRNLISIEWTKKDSLVSVTPLVSDFSGKDAMSIRLIPDSASDLNAAGQALSFTLILRDADGGVAKVTTAANQNALRPYPGELKETILTEDFSIKYWEPTTPLGMLHIPLSCFEALDMSAIVSMELLFDNSESGALFIASWQLQ